MQPIRLSRSSLAPLGAGALVLLMLAPEAGACDQCRWGIQHPTDGADIQKRIDLYHASRGPDLRLGGGSGPAANQFLVTQQVWIDFSTQSGEYSAQEMSDVLAGIQTAYSAFDLSFSLTQPVGAYTTLVFDNGGLGGVADELDFRNLNPQNEAFVGTDTDDIGGFTSAQQVNYAVNVGSHELGHTLGLRHQDGYGPIGQGVPNSTAGGAFLPDFPGLVNATEFSGNIMSTPAWGSDVNVFFNTRAAHSERELIKLSFNEQITTINEAPGAKGSIATAQPVTMQTLDVPNMRPPGTAFHGEEFDVTAAVVLGNLSTTTEDDFYSFTASEGDLVIIEVISQIFVFSRMPDKIDALATVRNAAGTVLAYYSSTASNDDEPESFDPLIMDLIIPQDGTYFVSVDQSPLAAESNKAGNYELYVATFNTLVPEPAALGLLAVGGLLLLRRRAA